MTLILAWKVKYFLPTVFLSDWMFLGLRFQNIGSANHVDNGFHPMFGVNRAFLVEGSVDIISVLENRILFLAF